MTGVAGGLALAVENLVPGAVAAPPEWAVAVVCGVLGFAVGSFLNVVVYRVPRHLSIVRPPSFCPRCQTPVRPRDNVPVVSWVILGGHCRTCGEPISVRYPLVETGTGLLFVLVALAVGPHWAVAGFCALAAAVVAAAAVELDGMPPPPSIAIVGTVIGASLLAAAAGADHLWRHGAGAGVGALVAVALALGASRWTPASGGERWRGPGWQLLPAGVVLGWVGSVGAAAGIGALGVLVLVLPAVRHPVQGARPGGIEAAGVGVAVVAACVVAVVVAVAVGPSLVR